MPGVCQKNIMVVIEEEEEEVKRDHVDADLNIYESATKEDALQDYITEFCDIDDEKTLNVKTFIMKDNSNEIVRDISLDEEYPKWDNIKCEGKSQHRGIVLNDHSVLDAVFNDIFPCIKGHAKLIDGYHSFRNS